MILTLYGYSQALTQHNVTQSSIPSTIMFHPSEISRSSPAALHEALPHGLQEDQTEYYLAFHLQTL
jgi:hypothetical protein